MSKIGIDLGTTYSCIAYLDENGKPAISLDSDDNVNTPSVILFHDDGTIVVGTEAKETGPMFDSECLIESIKRQIGTDYQITFNGKTYDPTSLSALILKKLLDDYETRHGERPKEAVITCPAYFKNNERMATKEAGILAGLEKVTLINEPTAAAICFGFGQEEDCHKRILIYDLGGGTFDVTILQIDGREFNVIATDGERKLGGKDWDKCIINLVLNKINQIAGINVAVMNKNRDLISRLTNDAENIKKRLTNNKFANMTTIYKGMKYRYTITREEFEDATRHLMMETTDVIDRTLKSKEITADMIDEIVLVGGSSLMPQVANTIRAMYPNNAVSIYDPHESIAKGAAIYSGSLEKYEEEKKKAESKETVKKQTEEQPLPEKIAKIPDMKMTDVLSSSFGVVAKVCGQDMISNIIFKNNPLPITEKRTYYLLEDEQAELEVNVYESSAENDKSGRNIPLDEGVKFGSFVMNLPLGVTRETPVEITFNATKEGILTATAECNGITCTCNMERSLN